MTVAHRMADFHPVAPSRSRVPYLNPDGACVAEPNRRYDGQVHARHNSLPGDPGPPPRGVFVARESSHNDCPESFCLAIIPLRNSGLKTPPQQAFWRYTSMSGHSKWSTIKRKKGAADAKRGKIFSRLAKEIAVAAKMGGGDPAANPRLRTVLLAARAQNMPKDNVEKAIKKGTGELPGVTYDEIRYECYGPSGVAVIMDVLTDNRNRTVAEIRHLVTKYGGNLAETGAVTWNFEPKGMITIPKGDLSDDDMFEKAIEAGAEDVDTEGETFEITTDPHELHTVVEAFEAMGLSAENAQLTMTPKTTVQLTGKEAASVIRFMEFLEDQEDMQNIFANFDISEEEMAALMDG